MERTLLLIPRLILALGVTASAASAVSAQVVADSACPKYAVDIASFATCEGDRVARDVDAAARREQNGAASAGQGLGKASPVVGATRAGSTSVSTTRSGKSATVSNVDRRGK